MSISRGELVKILLFAALLVVAAGIFGSVCGRIYRETEVILSPSPAALDLALWFFLALGLMALTAGLVAALVRPLWLTLVILATSALAMVVTWGPTLQTAGWGLIYFGSAALYTRGVAKGLEDRLSFSTEPIGHSQGVLLFVLAALACFSFYRGYAEAIERSGTLLPPAFKVMVTDMALPRIQSSIEERTDLTPEEKAATLTQMKEEFEREFIGALEKTLRPYARLIPAGLAFALFWTLETVIGLLSWIPVAILSLLFPLLTRLGVSRVVTETKEAKRLTLG